MAVVSEKQKVSLKLEYADGYTSSGKERFRTKTYSGLNPKANDEAVFRTGEGIQTLLNEDVRVIKKVEESILTENL
ncbi:MAG: DUF1659 domain-containing protein [Tissierellia bacterium]|nr:DUF1659 domain-containing protein [Tissierellia bacterium]